MKELHFEQLVNVAFQALRLVVSCRDLPLSLVLSGDVFVRKTAVME